MLMLDHLTTTAAKALVLSGMQFMGWLTTDWLLSSPQQYRVHMLNRGHSFSPFEAEERSGWLHVFCCN